jgi:DNA polymerase-1
MSELLYYLGPDPPGTDKLLRFKELIMDASPKLISVDCETVSLDDRTPTGIGVSVDSDHSFYFPCEDGSANPLIPWKLLINPSVKKIYHNALFDLDATDTLAADAELGPIDTTNIADTAVMARMMCKDRIGLEFLAWEVSKNTDSVKMLLTKHKATDTLKIPEAELALHCLQDTQAAYGLYLLWSPHVDMQYHDTEMQVISLLIRMSKKGIAVDQVVRGYLEERLTKETEYLKSLCEGFGFNPASPQQVGHILAKKGTMLPFNKDWRGKPTSYNTSEGVLEFVDDPLAALVINYRHAAKLLNTYIVPLRGEPRAYTHFHLDAVTGRVSSKNINMQNIPPGEPRNMYLPDSGIFTDIDWSQIELRVLAHVSKDLDMKRIFDETLGMMILDERDKRADIHQETASFLNIPRRLAKNINFGMIYGATANTLRETAKIRNVRQCEQLIHDWFLKFKGAGDWIHEVQELGLKKGYVTTIFNRRIRLPLEEDNEDGLRRKAVNYTIQASAAEIVKRAMIKCKHLPMVLQVHDELLFDGKVELPEGLDWIAPFHTPITVKELSRWE